MAQGGFARALRQVIKHPCPLLQGQIAGGEDIGMTEAEHGVDFGRPDADTLDGDKGGDDLIGGRVAQGGVVDAGGGKRMGISGLLWLFIIMLYVIP